MARSTIHDPVIHQDAIWLVEHDRRPNEADVLRVIVCHRSGTPACVRITPADISDAEAFAAWSAALPPPVRYHGNFHGKHPGSPHGKGCSAEGCPHRGGPHGVGAPPGHGPHRGKGCAGEGCPHHGKHHGNGCDGAGCPHQTEPPPDAAPAAAPAAP